MLKLQFYNTQKGSKQEFLPIDAGAVRMYVCGATVYDDVHIGNARSFVVFDVLFRLLRFVYGKEHVFYARNITDVDDKINNRALVDFPALPINEAIDALTEQTIASFHHVCSVLGCLPPSFEPRARHFIEKMKWFIEHLLQKGHAYIAEEHVIFSVKTLQGPIAYGSFARRNLEMALAGARVEIASYKRDTMDFVLWKPSKKGEPSWPSPAGIQTEGRPGWHIECSAMSLATLVEAFGGGLEIEDSKKNLFDIHGGGRDLLFPHHQNEVAQSCSLLGTTQMANFWLHNGFVMVEGQKMSKSLGNFIKVPQLLQMAPSWVEEEFGAKNRDCFSGLALRLGFIQTHYREALNWTEERFFSACQELAQWYEALHEKELLSEEEGDVAVPSAIIDALANDLNTPQALTYLRQEYKKMSAGALRASLQFLGLFEEVLLEERSNRQRNLEQDPQIKALVSLRLKYLAEKKWHKADEIRESLLRKGVSLQDVKDPQTGQRYSVITPTKMRKL